MICPHQEAYGSVLTSATSLESLELSLGGLGASLRGQARAYPLAELDWHEVVNDDLGGLAIAVTW